MTAFKCEDCEKIRSDIKEAVAELKSADTNKVLEDIKAEIESNEREAEYMNDWNDGYNSAIYDVLQLIDRHISGKEQE